MSPNMKLILSLLSSVCILLNKEKKHCKNGTCVHIVRQKLSWFEAESYCKSKFNGHLASIHSDEQQKWIQSLLDSGDSKGFHFGLSKKTGARQFYYTDGTPYDYSKWQINQPDNYGGSENCVELKGGEKHWNDLPCSIKKPFICMEKPFATIERKTTEYRECYCGNCYIYVKETKNYANAESYCKSMGGHLASFHSQVVYDWVADTLMTKVRLPGLWFYGANDIAVEGRWRYTDGSPFDFQYWAGGEPNNGNGNGDEDCGHIYYYKQHVSQNKKINDIPCYAAFNSICKLGQTYYAPNTFCH